VTTVPAKRRTEASADDARRLLRRVATDVSGKVKELASQA
jgi:hypothetical protein